MDDELIKIARSKRLKQWESPQGLSLIRMYARRYRTMKDIADKMGINRITLYKWIKESEKMREALNRGTTTTIAMVEDVLVQEAVNNRRAWAVELFLKTYGGERYNPERYIGTEITDSDDMDLTNELFDVMDGLAGEQ